MTISPPQLSRRSSTFLVNNKTKSTEGSLPAAKQARLERDLEGQWLRGLEHCRVLRRSRFGRFGVPEAALRRLYEARVIYKKLPAVAL